jgi:DNA mismatch repair protein MutS
VTEPTREERRGKRKADDDGHTPVMRQFLRAKQQYPDAIVFFRMGDFYEVFFDDAALCSAALGITLTSRAKGPDGDRIPMAGVPHHAGAAYIAELIGRGHRVAICEQMADPQTVKGIVPREVVRVVTPALCLDPTVLEARQNSFLVAVERGGDAAFGFAALDISTGELRHGEAANEAVLIGELVRLDPRELLLGRSAAESRGTLAKVLPRAALREEALREEALLEGALLGGAQENDGARVESDDAVAERVIGALGTIPALAAPALRSTVVAAVAAAVRYAEAAQPGTPLIVERVLAHDARSSVALDAVAIENLELVQTTRGEKKGALLDCIDETRTAMGARALRMRILAPSTDAALIGRWHDAVAASVSEPDLRRALRRTLGEIGDIERLTARAVQGVMTPRDLAALRAALLGADELKRAIDAHDGALPDALRRGLPTDLCAALRGELETKLSDDPPATHLGGGVVRPGAFPEIDSLRGLASDSKDLLLALEARERATTGIGSLKVKYTRVFGYYIEVTRSNLKLVPAHYRRKQTIANGERFATEELDALQVKIVGAEDEANELEANVFLALRERVCAARTTLHRLAGAIAELDVHLAFAELAERRGHVRPTVDDSTVIDIVDGRHPVVEAFLPAGTFVPNDVHLDAGGERLWLITGPNMAGKSTVLRQVALTVILAQAGGFVPAKSARIGIVDRVHTRVGASDNLSRGQSTFMVEMVETAAILSAATSRSLVLLDEVGRGTSTYDGLAIARAVAEYVADVVRCRTMFATHYHELCELEQSHAGVVNYNTVAKESPKRGGRTNGDDRDGAGPGIVFLHRLVRGGASKSYGIEVARLAGLPESVLRRAREVLASLETARAVSPSPASKQLSLESLTSREAPMDAQTDAPGALSSVEVDLLAEVRALAVNDLTPVEALVFLDRLRKRLQGKS